MERIERHDILNAIGLAAVLLAMALGLLTGARALFNTVNGAVEAEKPEEEVVAGATTSTTAATATTESSTTTTVPVLHPPNEVIIRVGNGAQRPGIAGAGTSILTDAGYQTLSAKNAAATQASVVYYIDGYQADAAQVARLLGVGETAIAPMVESPGGVPQETAHLVAILGSDTTVG